MPKGGKRYLDNVDIAYTLCHVWHQLCNVTSKIPQTNLRTRYERKKLRQPDVDTVHQSTVERFIRIEENESEDSDAGNAIDDDEGGAGDTKRRVNRIMDVPRHSRLISRRRPWIF